MKTKLDFVTNSSSSSFILAIEKSQTKNIEKYLAELNEDADAYNEGVTCRLVAKTMKSLNTYTNGCPFDWASKPMGIRYYNMAEEEYLKCKNIIKDGRAVVLAYVDWNVCKKFESRFGNCVVASYDS